MIVPLIKNQISIYIVTKRHHFLLLLIFLLSLMALFFSTEVKTVVFKHTALDSIGHFIGFFCLSLLLNYILKFPLLVTTCCLALYAVLSEVGQDYLGFRNGEFRDVVADIIGILSFAFLKCFYSYYWRKTSQ
jgi:VanZ family protein|tara:strand:- start:1300 stop:1695 length:396 start_codon:yes stop_codon:yes gene_type:complete